MKEKYAKSLVTLIICCLLSTVMFSQTINVEYNYKNWGWEKVFVAKNKYIHLSIVPEAAGRILEYNLGDIPSLWINPKLLGKSYAPNDMVRMDEWRNFGGFRLVPIPIDNCAQDIFGNKTKRWPPPAIIGDSPYVSNLSINENGQEVLEVISGIQDLPVPLYDNKTKKFSEPSIVDEQIQYKRQLYIEDNSSLVYITHTLTNKGIQSVKRGIMTTSQHVSRSKPELTDGGNFLSYIPFSDELKVHDEKPYHITTDAESRWRYINKNRFPLDKNNPEHVEKYYNHGTNWLGEVAPAVYGVHFDYNLMGGLHIIASKPWICYVNKLDSTVFAKIFEPYDPDLFYEDGVNVAVFNSGMETGYLETEVKTPIYDLQPGAHFVFKEIHAAAKILKTPVLDINATGVITERLNVNSISNKLGGSYGVFIEGKAILRVLKSSPKATKEFELSYVDPLHALKISCDLLKNIERYELYIKDAKGAYHLLDSCKITL